MPLPMYAVRTVGSPVVPDPIVTGSDVPPPPFPRTCGGRRRLSSQSDSHTLDLDIDQGLKTRDLAPIIAGRRCAVDAH